MAREKVDNKLNVVIGTKAQIEGDTSIPENSIIVVTDSEKLKADEIAYSAEKNVQEAIEDLEVTVGNIDSILDAILRPNVVELTQAQYDAFPTNFKLVWGQASPITPFVWNDTGTTLYVASDAGISNLAAPYNTISGSHIFATEAEAETSYTTASGQKALVTGFKWVSSSAGEYDTAGYKITKSGNFDGHVVESDANRLIIPSYELWDYGQWSVALRIDDIGIGYSYWKLTIVDETFTGSPKVYESITRACPVVGYSHIGTSCSIEGEKMIVSGTDIGMPGDCYELTCYSKETTYDDNTYYLIVEE